MRDKRGGALLSRDAEELERLAYENAVKLEITGGVPTWEAFPGALRQFLIDQIRASIAPRNADPDGCACFHLSDVLFRFPDGSLKRPDIAIFCVRPVLENAALTVIPDAVVEIVSSGYEYKDVTLN